MVVAYAFRARVWGLGAWGLGFGVYGFVDYTGHT